MTDFESSELLTKLLSEQPEKPYQDKSLGDISLDLLPYIKLSCITHFKYYITYLTTHKWSGFGSTFYFSSCFTANAISAFMPKAKYINLLMRC